MGSLVVIPLMGFLGILFITLNLIVIALIILTIVFGIIRIIKSAYFHIYTCSLRVYRISSNYSSITNKPLANLIFAMGKSFI